METKVSMIITCFNKQDYIGKMLDSVIAQTYNNIEVIVVNDGSTDESFSIIKKYVPMLKERGYTVVVIEQENMGRASALKMGLKRLTGAFVFMPDGDDTLLTNYVSGPVKHMLEHPDVDLVVSDFSGFSYASFENQYLKSIAPVRIENLSRQQLIKMWTIRIDLNPSIWTSCVRTSYLKRCGIVENIAEDRNFSQEPQVMLPLLIGGGKLYYNKLPIYEYNTKAVSSVCNDAYLEKVKIEKFIDSYIQCIRIQLKNNGIFNAESNAALKVNEITWLFLKSHFHTEKELIDRILNYVIINTNQVDVYKAGMSVLHHFIASTFCNLQITDKVKVKKEGKIIAYGAFSKAAAHLRTGLHHSDIIPHIYWDIAAKPGDKIMEIPVYRPDFEQLSGNETILMLLKNCKIAEDVTKRIKAVSPDTPIIYFYDILDYLANYYFSEAPTASLKSEMEYIW